MLKNLSPKLVTIGLYIFSVNQIFLKIMLAIHGFLLSDANPDLFRLKKTIQSLNFLGKYQN